MSDGGTEGLIAALEVERIAAMERNDVDAIASFIHDQCIYTHSLGDRDTRDAYIAKCRDGVIKYNRLGCAVESILVRGNVALVFGRMDGDAQVSGRPRRLYNCYTAVWARDAGNWQVIAFQPTPILS